MNARRKKFLIRLIILGSLVFLIVLFLILRNNEVIAEAMTNTFGRAYHFIVSYLFGYIPISIFGLAIFGIIAYVIVWLVRLIKHLKKNGSRFSSKYYFNIAYVFLSIGLVYILTAGMAYNRASLPFATFEGEVTQEEYIEIAYYFLEDYNKVANELEFDEETGALIRPYTTKEINSLLKEEFSKLDSDYFYAQNGNIKEFYLLSYIYTELHITGVTFVPFAEGNINRLSTASEYGFVMAHEMAHTVGVMREEDANLVAFYICYTSEDPYLRYNAYTRTFTSLYPFLLAGGGIDAYAKFLQAIDSKITLDRAYTNSYWSSFTLLDDIGSFFNDIYLYFMGNEGTISYTDNIDTDVSEDEEGEIVYTISSYSRYQNMYLNFYYDENS